MISGTCEPLKLCKECWDVSANPHHTHFSEHHTSSSNPTASTGVDRGQTVTCKIAVFWRLARLEKRLDLGCATRNTTPQAPCTELHGRYRTPKELARNAKNPGKTRVLQHGLQKANGEDRNRTFGCFFQCFFENSKGAKSVTLASRQITSSKD